MFFFYRVVPARSHRTTALVAGAVAHAFRIVWQVKVMHTYSHFILRPHTSALSFTVFCSPFSFTIVIRVSAAPSAFDRPMQGALGQATGVYFYLPPPSIHIARHRLLQCHGVKRPLERMQFHDACSQISTAKTHRQIRNQIVFPKGC